MTILPQTKFQALLLANFTPVIIIIIVVRVGVVVIIIFVVTMTVVEVVIMIIIVEVVMKNLGQLPTESELLRMVREVSST